MAYRTALVSGIAVAALMAAFLASGINDTADLEATFLVGATYYEESGTVRVSFEDTSGRSTSVTMEILGMDETFQRTYEQASFAEDVRFDLRPKFGWKVHPVTFVVEHPDLGKIGIKTEIRAPGEPEPGVIFSRL